MKGVSLFDRLAESVRTTPAPKLPHTEKEPSDKGPQEQTTRKPAVEPGRSGVEPDEKEKEGADEEETDIRGGNTTFSVILSNEGHSSDVESEWASKFTA